MFMVVLTSECPNSSCTSLGGRAVGEEIAGEGVAKLVEAENETILVELESRT